MLFGYFTLAVALLIEIVGAYYSITGLAAIFSGAVIPILIMGGSLELGKVVAAIWLKNNWERASLQFKAYLLPAVIVLMLITSMGIFGFLSKAHNDQNLVSGDVQGKIAIYDEKIRTARDNIDANRKALKQMDEAVDQIMGRSNDEKGADKAVAIRRGQQKERARLQSEISAEQKTIIALNEERAPIAAEVRKVEAEVGPIKYIAKLIYDDNPDTNILEKAVVWVIMIIVAVFDPLALVLILAAQQSIRWAQGEEPEHKKESVESWFDRVKKRARFWDTQQAEIDETPSTYTAPAVDHLEPVVNQNRVTSAENEYFETDNPKYEPDDGLLTDHQIDQIKESVDQENKKKTVLSSLDSMWENAKRMIKGDPEAEHAPLEAKTKDPEPKFSVDHDHEDDEHDIDELEKQARRNWKEAHPDETIKKHRRLHESGFIDKLPWNHPDYHPGLQNLGLEPDNVPTGHTGEVKGFGTSFPTNSAKGDMFLRVDQLPSALYKFNGNQWIEVDKTLSDQHAYDDAYIDHLIEKISTGEYDPELLSNAERDQIEQRLTNSKQV
jgi:hypothetical protein